jgi:hypothetical protein
MFTPRAPVTTPVGGQNDYTVHFINDQEITIYPTIGYNKSYNITIPPIESIGKSVFSLDGRYLYIVSNYYRTDENLPISYTDHNGYVLKIDLSSLTTAGTVTTDVIYNTITRPIEVCINPVNGEAWLCGNNNSGQGLIINLNTTTAFFTPSIIRQGYTFSPDGLYIYSASSLGSLDGYYYYFYLYLYKTSTTTGITTTINMLTTAQPFSCPTLFCSNDGVTLYVLTQWGNLFTYKILTGISAYINTVGILTSASLSPDGIWLYATGSIIYRPSLLVFNTTDWTIREQGLLSVYYSGYQKSIISARTRISKTTGVLFLSLSCKERNQYYDRIFLINTADFSISNIEYSQFTGTGSQLFSVDDNANSFLMGMQNNNILIQRRSIPLSEDIYYTLNGDFPDNSDTLYSSPFLINDSALLNAISYVVDTLWNTTLFSAESSLATRIFSRKIASLPPVMIPPSCSFSTSIDVELRCPNIFIPVILLRSPNNELWSCNAWFSDMSFPMCTQISVPSGELSHVEKEYVIQGSEQYPMEANFYGNASQYYLWLRCEYSVNGNPRDDYSKFYEIDGVTKLVTRRININRTIISSVVSDNFYIWALTSNGYLLKIECSTGNIVGELFINNNYLRGRVSNMVYKNGHLWFSFYQINENTSYLYHINVANFYIISTISIEGMITVIEHGENYLWAVSNNSNITSCYKLSAAGDSVIQEIIIEDIYVFPIASITVSSDEKNIYLAGSTSINHPDGFSSKYYFIRHVTTADGNVYTNRKIPVFEFGPYWVNAGLGGFYHGIVLKDDYLCLLDLERHNIFTIDTLSGGYKDLYNYTRGGVFTSTTTYYSLTTDNPSEFYESPINLTKTTTISAIQSIPYWLDSEMSIETYLKQGIHSDVVKTAAGMLFIAVQDGDNIISIQFVPEASTGHWRKIGTIARVVVAVQNITLVAESYDSLLCMVQLSGEVKRYRSKSQGTTWLDVTNELEQQ